MKIITGMHRSGTSLVARLFHEAGADLGPRDTFYRADRWNPDGYFEQPDVQAANMKLIHGPFWKLAYFRLPSAEVIVRRSDRLSARLRAVAQKYAGKVVKDARFCLTLPAWRRHAGGIDGALVCLREPASVARSVERRNRISRARAERLWLEHNQRLLEALDGLPVWYVRYANLLDPAAQKGELGAALRFFGLSASDARLGALLAAVKQERDHAPRAGAAALDAAQALWRELLARHAGQA